MKILTYFTEYGIPKEGLSPTIRIRKLSDNSLVITDAAMSEVGDGSYAYNFTGYTNEEYSIRCYGGSGLPIEEQYSYGGFDTTDISNDIVIC